MTEQKKACRTYALSNLKFSLVNLNTFLDYTNNALKEIITEDERVDISHTMSLNNKSKELGDDLDNMIQKYPSSSKPIIDGANVEQKIKIKSNEDATRFELSYVIKKNLRLDDEVALFSVELSPRTKKYNGLAQDLYNQACMLKH